MSGLAAAGFVLEGISDVLEFPRENVGEESSLTRDRWYSHLRDLMKNGNKAFREGKLDLAIDFYSKANDIKPGDPIILSNRCTAYLRICHFLMHRPSSASEYRPLNGLDPTSHAGLALKDAEKVMSFQRDSVMSYILKANALILLEKYTLAWDIISAGLEIDPLKYPELHVNSKLLFYSVFRTTILATSFLFLSDPLLKLKKFVGHNFLERRNLKPLRTDDFDCTLCLKLLYEPVTTPCGHSFCRSCLLQSMDRGNRCPLCRTVLLISSRTCSVSVTLNNIIEKSFPDEFAERKAEHESLKNPGVHLLPLFVMDVILPCQKLQLNIFEPRYRLMVRRIMEGSRRMGMAAVDSSTGLIADYACEVEITDCEPLADGRFILEIESRRRCRIIQHWEQDGYRISEVEWVRDISSPQGTIELLEMCQKAAEFARHWIKEAQDAAQGDRARLATLFIAEGLMPPTNDPESFSFWLVTLTNRRPSDRLDLLRIRDTRERIRRGLLYMKADGRCRMQ